MKGDDQKAVISKRESRSSIQSRGIGEEDTDDVKQPPFDPLILREQGLAHIEPSDRHFPVSSGRGGFAVIRHYV